MNTTVLEWFGPPERNTLCPLCFVLPCLEGVRESLCSCVYIERLPFISQGDAYMAVGTPTGGPNDIVQDNALFMHYGVAGKEIFLLDSLACSRSPSSIMS